MAVRNLSNQPRNNLIQRVSNLSNIVADIPSYPLSQEGTVFTIGDSTVEDVEIIGNIKFPNYAGAAVTGTATHNLTIDANGNVIAVAITAGGIENVVEDLTPQLGGNLDFNTFKATGIPRLEFAAGNMIMGDSTTAAGIGGNGNIIFGNRSYANASGGILDLIIIGRDVADGATTGTGELHSSVIIGQEALFFGSGVTASSSGNAIYGNYAFGFAETIEDTVGVGNAVGGVGVDISDSTYLGAYIDTGATTVINVIVIGGFNTGMGSNTAVYGNLAITDSYIRGQLHSNVYGVGNFTGGSPVYYLVVDAGGNLLELAI